MNVFADKLINWYENNKRDLPWRHTKNPYLIWVSEIILQQTRVAQGYDYYIRFVKRFPDVYALAEADEDEVMRYWQGLGYYSRARNLHSAAKYIADLGYFPIKYEEVRALKGVGEYTAAAICSFAYDMPYAVVDGNVYRVLSRWLGLDTPIDSTQGKKQFADLAFELLDVSRPALYNQAIMEFGALQCIPISPDCVSCPLADSCVAIQQRKVEEFPVKQHKVKVTIRYFNYIYVRMGAYTFINKRINNDIWMNLYEFPLIETKGKTEKERDQMFLKELQTVIPGCHFIKPLQKGIKHVLSHRIIYANFYEVEMPEDTLALNTWLKVPVKDLHKFAVPNLVSHFFSLILEPKHQNE